ncbi:MAG: hypothetical protein RLZZ158_1461, partial [Cyanobacteriota bacterium]
MATPLIRSVKANGNKLAIEFAGLVDTSGLAGGFTIDADGSTIEITSYSQDPSTTLLTLEADTDFPADYRLIYDGASGGIKLVAGAGSLGPFQAVFQSEDIIYEVDENHLGILIEGSAGGLQGFASSESIDLVGNSGENLLEAGKSEAAVTLDGGPGADNLIGGAGDNTYIVDNVGDNVTELETAGTATVESSVDYILGDYVDNLTLAGAFDINATGNSLDNVLTGNAGNNILDGGAGADVLKGGKGNDTYIVDDAGDTITEIADSGTDLVKASLDFDLSTKGNNIENLTLTGTGNIYATGNELANVLTGNAGNNILDGGAGADELKGGKGDDTYIVDDSADKITEEAGVDSGTDLVISSATNFKLGANLENLTLTGTGNINATGNGENNVLTGNAGNNILDGGAGADEL